MPETSSRDTRIRTSIFLSTLSNILGKVIVLVLGFLLTPVMLNYLGQDQYGLWTLFGMVVGYGMLLDFGVSGAVIKYVSEYRIRGEREELSQLVSSALSLYTLVAILAIALGLLLSPAIAGQFQVRAQDRELSVVLIALASLAAGLSVPWILFNAVLRGLHRFDLVNIITVLGSLFYWTGMLTVLLLGGGLTLMALTHISMMLLMALAAFFLIRRIAPEIQINPFNINRRMAGKVLTFSMSLFAIALASRLQTQSDEIVIGALLPVAMVTPYFLARRLSEIPEALSDQFMKVIMPLASELNAENDQARLRLLYLTSTRLTLVGFVPFAVILVILAPTILSVWVGVEYAPYSHLVTILVIASLIGTSQYPAGAVLQGIARQKTLAYTSSASAIVNLGLSLTLIHPLGLTGVAIGTLIPRTLESFGYVLPFTMKIMGVDLRTAFVKMLLPALMPAIPMGLLLYFLEQVVEPSNWFEILFLMAPALLVYAAVYLAFGAAPRERWAYWELALEIFGKAQKAFARS